MKKSLVILGIALVSFSNVTGTSYTSDTFEAIALDYKLGTPLCAAISKGDVATVKKFIEYGVNVNEKSNGLTPLMIAARYNNVEIVKLLLQNGADPKVKNENGLTALRYAEQSNASDVVALLSNYNTK